MSDLPVAQDTQQRWDYIGEAYRRGLLPPDRARYYEEGVKRGLFKPPPQAAQPTGVLAPGGALTDPNAPPAADTQIGVGLAAPGKTPTPARQQRGIIDVAGDRAANIKGEMRLLQGYDPQVDYDQGTGWTDAVAMHRADTPAEKRAYLTRRYGPDNVFTDRGGRFVVRDQAGKLVSPEASGFMNSFLPGLAAEAPILVGSVGGSIAGAPGGPLSAVAGAMAGGALGKTLIEGGKALEGGVQKTLPETAQAIGMTGLASGAGEAGGRLLTGVPGMLGSAFRKYITGATPETRDLAASVARAGGVAPLRSVTPGLSSPIQKQDISARLGADWLEDRNRAAVHTRLAEILDSTGMNQAERDAALREILEPTARVSAREAGAPVLGEVRQHAAHLEANVENIARDADRQLAQQLNALQAIPRRAPAGNLGMDIATGISEARRDFSRSMQNIYAQVDRAVAPAQRPTGPTYGPNPERTEEALFGTPSANVGPQQQEFPGIVPTGAIKREARRIIQALPKDAEGNPIFGDPRVLKSIGQLRDLGPKITLSDAQRIRSTLGEMGEFTDLTPGIAKRQFDDLRQSINTAMRMAEADPAAAPALRMLRRADQLYSEGVRRFEDSTINQIAQQARTGMMPDPGAIADKVLQPKFTSRAQEIRSMVGPDVWRRVASADFGNIMQAARDPQTGEIAARKLASLIRAKDQNGLLELTYGPRLAGEMRLYSQRMDARGGAIPAGALNPDNFGQAMGRLEAAQARRDAFLSNNYLSELTKPGAMADDAINFVLKPGQETRLIEAQRFFGDTSPQMAAIRQQGLKELLNSAIVRTETGAGTTVVGDGIDQALRKWTPRQQEIMFPNGLADDMRRLAQEIRFMFPVKRDQIGGALIAGSVKDLPLSLRIPGGRIPMTAYYEAMGWLYSQPRVVKALASGLQPGPGKAVTRETIRMIFREAAVGELPHPNEEAEPGVLSAPQAAMRVMGRNYGLGPQALPPSGLRGGGPATAAPPTPATPPRTGRRNDGETIEPPARELRQPAGAY